jgi:hypothetical protein
LQANKLTYLKLNLNISAPMNLVAVGCIQFIDPSFSFSKKILTRIDNSYKYEATPFRGAVHLTRDHRQTLPYQLLAPYPCNLIFKLLTLPPNLCIGDIVFQDLHAYDPATMAWTDLSAPTIGTPPIARCYHGFTSVEGKLYVHGGYKYGERPSGGELGASGCN